MTQVQEISAKEPYSIVLSAYTQKRTIDSYAEDYYALDRFLLGSDPWKMTRNQMAEFITTLKEKGSADRTIARRMAAYKKLFKYGMEFGGMTEDPTLAFEDFNINPTTSLPKPLSKDQREHLKACLQWDEPLNCRVSLMVMIGLLTGLRLNEIRLLKWEDIDFDKRSLHAIDERSNGTVVHIPPPLLKILKEHKATGYVIGEVSHPEVGWWNRKIVKRWCGWSDEVNYSCNVLRDSFITELVENDVPIENIKKIARLKSLESTSKYFKIRSVTNESELDRVFK